MTLHFFGQHPSTFQEAHGSNGRHYQIMRNPILGPGWMARIFDVHNSVIKIVDWSDHHVHVDELRKHLSKLDAASVLLP